MRFIRKRNKEEDEESFSWGDYGEEKERSHSMWSREIKKLLKKVGLC